MLFKTKTFENFVSLEESNTIIEFVKTVDVWQDAGGQGFWDNRTLNAFTIYHEINKDIGILLYNIRQRTKDFISSNMTDGIEVYPDLFQVVRWMPGMEQPPHEDDMKSAGNGYEWYHHRHFGAITYLNDNFLGGETYYPNHNISIKPKAGMLAVHPGDSNHLHGVTKVQDNIRYTLASFWTLDKEYFDGWTIHESERI